MCASIAALGLVSALEGPNGERTLLIVSDNNFSQNQKTQIVSVPGVHPGELP
ncbi:MAG: hypothetical protein ACRDTF_04175 [Pseudonocardiaceae bacterium]